ncbi:hypothetical protein [Streptomyces tauricus]|uniref:hypothetical protein n=1 Tax=Streptomyces tauricus TaxID=68274 RepID=UPI001FE704C4|nr:hypothetical protein [Streptomyces tauricus]MCW8101879.1 hypothetical protein [Streptomyces tauricus]
MPVRRYWLAPRALAARQASSTGSPLRTCRWYAERVPQGAGSLRSRGGPGGGEDDDEDDDEGEDESEGAGEDGGSGVGTGSRLSRFSSAWR